MVRSPWWYLKPALWLIGLAVILLLLAPIFLAWRYTSWYPKVWGARITVDAMSSPRSALYLDISRKCDGVLVRRTFKSEEFYAIGTGACLNFKFAWRCKDFGFTFLPGIASSNHIQFGTGCFAGFDYVDRAGKTMPPPKFAAERDLKIESKRIEFTADDGKRLRAEW